MAKLIDQIEHWHNKASDTDYVWFPFGKFKPQSHEPIDFKRRLLMSITFGLYYGIYYVVRRIFYGFPFEPHRALQVVMFAVSGFFVWFSLVTSFFWNRRARRIGAEKKTRA